MFTIVSIGLILFVAYLWGFIDAKSPQRIVAIAKGPLNRMIYRQLMSMKSEKARMGVKQRQFKSYQHYLGSYEWNRISTGSAVAMSGKCEFCGEKYESVHHWRYPDREDLSNENIASLIVVCRHCHTSLHGHNAVDKNLCALCKKASPTTTLAITLRRVGQSSIQSVCRNCKAIATGRRFEANGSNFDEYEKWVDQWQQELLETYR